MSIFGIFRGSFGHFYALVEFSMHLIHAHALMHINWLKIQICVLGGKHRSHARNGNECQTPCHRHSAANVCIIQIACVMLTIHVTPRVLVLMDIGGAVRTTA